MMDKMECMCTECGVSNFIPQDHIVLDDSGEGKFIRNVFCLQCGGLLFLVGKAGDEPFYKL